MNTESNANGRVTRMEYRKSRAPMMFGSDLVVTSLPGRGSALFGVGPLAPLGGICLCSLELLAAARSATSHGAIYDHGARGAAAPRAGANGKRRLCRLGEQSRKQQTERRRRFLVRGQRQTRSGVQGTATHRLRPCTSRQFRADHSAASSSGAAKTAGSIATPADSFHCIGQAGTRAAAASGNPTEQAAPGGGFGAL